MVFRDGLHLGVLNELGNSCKLKFLVIQKLTETFVLE